MSIIVTGAAGFCGFHVVRRLLDQGVEVVGVDVFSDYYDVALKRARIAALGDAPGFSLHEFDLSDAVALHALFASARPSRVIHLAAQPGVRHSIAHPEDYLQNNLVVFGNVLEACRRAEVAHLVYASSSSVYGGNVATPFSERDAVDHPLSLYAATKKANELMAHSYSHLFGLPTTGLRFFTVYGPWGRPDMAPWLFTEAILGGRPIKVFNQGQSIRDFTYADDVARVVAALIERPAAAHPQFDRAHPRPDSGAAPFRIFNVGNEQPVRLLDFITTLEHALGREALKQFLPAQPGDMDATQADVTSLRAYLGFAPNTTIAEGLDRWAHWYRHYHRLN
ncbi:MAG: NAD-dependent epimerase/dehydratase family protein [Burkholderiales bacterium]|nr:NAD-dependent epimerase/dehydratase family protein [Burkholderiales bacterium]